MRLYKYYFTFLVLISFLGCSQEYNIKSVPKNIINQYISFYPKPANITFYNLEKDLPPNYDKTGTVDYTKIIQNSINTHRNIVFPSFPLKINKDGLIIPSNSTLYFDRGSRLVFSGPALTRDSDVLKIYKIKNVKIYNPTIEGSKFSRERQEGEWSAGFAIYGADNVEIYNVKIYNTYGDGIIFGDHCKNIKVQGGWIDQARRDGISIVSGENVIIKDLLISNTNGTLPMCGIQVEPNFPSDFVDNITINNITGYNNRNTTLNFNVSPMNQKNDAYKRTIRINANTITDYYSNYAIGFVLNPDHLQYTPVGGIEIKNVKSVNSNNFMWKDNGKSNINISSTNMIDKNKKRIQIK